MSSIMKKDSAEKLAFLHTPKPFNMQTSEIASDFVKRQNENFSGFELADVIAQQSGILELKKQQAEARVEDVILERLKEIQEPAYKQAYELGLVDGAEQAFKEQSEQIAERLKVFDSNNLKMNSLLVDLAKQYETTIIKTIFQLAKAIALREITLTKEPLLDALIQITGEIQSSESINVKMNPADLQFIEEVRKRGGRPADALQRVKIVPEDSIQSGGFLIETQYGAIDASINQRVEKAWQALEEKLPAMSKGT